MRGDGPPGAIWAGASRRGLQVSVERIQFDAPGAPPNDTPFGGGGGPTSPTSDVWRAC